MELEMQRMEREALAAMARKEQKKEQERQRKLVGLGPLCACMTGTWLLAHEVLGGRAEAEGRDRKEDGRGTRMCLRWRAGEGTRAIYMSCVAGRPCVCSTADVDVEFAQVRAILSTDSAIGVDAADANGNTLLSEAAVGGQAQARAALRSPGPLTEACNR